jgi:hypothetical protein
VEREREGNEERGRTAVTDENDAVIDGKLDGREPEDTPDGGVLDGLWKEAEVSRIYRKKGKRKSKRTSSIFLHFGEKSLKSSRSSSFGRGSDQGPVLEPSLA